MDQAQTFKSTRKLFDDFEKIPCLSNHKIYLVKSDQQLASSWEKVALDGERMLAEQAQLARRLYEFFCNQNLLDELSGIAPTELKCVYLVCSEQCWQRAKKSLSLTTLENPYSAVAAAS